LNPLGTKGDEDQITPRLVKTRDSVRLLQCSHFHTAFITGNDIDM
jgi:hypothetical protein